MITIFRLFIGLSILSLIVFTVNVGFAKMELSELGRAEALFLKLETAKGYMFIRNNKEISSKEMANLLRIKLAYLKSKNVSVESFIRDEVTQKNGYSMRQRFSKNRQNLGEYLNVMLAEVDKNTR